MRAGRGVSWPGAAWTGWAARLRVVMCCALAAALLASPAAGAAQGGGPPVARQDDLVWDLDSATPGWAYSNLVHKLRQRLYHSTSNGFLALPPQQGQPEIVPIRATYQGYTITLAMRRDNGYILGFRRASDKQLWVFSNVMEQNQDGAMMRAGLATAFPQVPLGDMGVGFRYDALLVRAGYNDLEEVPLSPANTRTAVATMGQQGYDPRKDRKELARFFLRLALELAEGMRFADIEDQVLGAFLNGEERRVTTEMRMRVKKWETISGRVQESQDGAFPPLHLQAGPISLDYTHTDQLAGVVAVLLFVCSGRSSTPEGHPAQEEGACPAPEPVGSGTITGPSGLCVDLAGNDRTNGTKIQVWDCDNTSAQKWEITGDGTIHLADAPGKCLAPDGAQGKGSRIVIWDCDGGGGQRWVVRADKTIVNPTSGLVLDATEKWQTPGTQLVLWDYNLTNAQLWTVPTTPVNVEITGVNGWCVDLDENNRTNGTKIKVWDCNHWVAQSWNLDAGDAIRLADGTTKCVEIGGDHTSSGSPVQIWDCNNGDNQKWRADADGSLVNPKTNRVLGITGGTSAQKGAQLVLSDRTGFTTQNWRAGPSAPRVATLTGRTGLCVDLTGGVTDNGTPLEVWGCNGAGNQKLSLYGDGTLRILDKCVDIGGDHLSNGSPVQIWECNNTAAQRWAIQGDGTIRNPQSGRNLDATTAWQTPGSKLQIYDRNATDAQLWKQTPP